MAGLQPGAFSRTPGQLEDGLVGPETIVNSYYDVCRASLVALPSYSNTTRVM